VAILILAVLGSIVFGLARRPRRRRRLAGGILLAAAYGRLNMG